jgi:hypothetical protein
MCATKMGEKGTLMTLHLLQLQPVLRTVQKKKKQPQAVIRRQSAFPQRRVQHPVFVTRVSPATEQPRAMVK